RVLPGAPVRLSLGQGVPPLAGRVSRIEPVAFTKVSALGIEEQRVNLIIAVDPPDAAPVQPGDGFRVDATVTLRVVDSALTVPGAALMRIGTRWAMMVHDQGRARQTEVQVLERGVERVWIGPGLVPGTQVVLYPGGQLQDGQRVSARVVPAEGS
ncbi:MAG: efflux transporter periplasmic adaptor subunit, partial [Burkholderiales bacterium]|nr:efflux transporter periplasmic adaptor subunit [Burkholderiales bacterium]